jgi:hypothetical protein
MGEFQESVMEQVRRLRELHTEATRVLRSNFEARRPTKPQPSTKLLDLRKIQVTFGPCDLCGSSHAFSENLLGGVNLLFLSFVKSKT